MNCLFGFRKGMERKRLSRRGKNGMERNEFNFIVVWIAKDVKERNIINIL